MRPQSVLISVTVRSRSNVGGYVALAKFNVINSYADVCNFGRMKT